MGADSQERTKTCRETAQTARKTKCAKQAQTASGRGETELSAEAEKEIPRQGQIITT